MNGRHDAHVENWSNVLSRVKAIERIEKGVWRSWV